MMRRYCVLSTLLLCCVLALGTLLSCNERRKEVPATDAASETFLKQFRTLDLPVFVDGCSISIDTLKAPVGEKFVGPDLGLLSFGRLQINDSIDLVILLGSADCWIPFFITVHRNGTIIDKKEVNIGGCGADCGFSCVERMHLYKDKTIYVADTVSSYDCDSLGDAIPGTQQHYVVYKKGMIRENGKIDLSKEMRIDL